MKPPTKGNSFSGTGLSGTRAKRARVRAILRLGFQGAILNRKISRFEESLNSTKIAINAIF